MTAYETYTIAEPSCPRPEFSKKDFPQPFFLPSPNPTRRHTTPTSESDITDSHPIVIRYIRSLVGITGVVTTSSMDNIDPLPEAMAPTGLGEAADTYLNAHGYDANSRLHIMHAWRENGHSGLADFVLDLCGKGMPMSEVEWLWYLLSNNN